jgi:hypothetical protein
MMHRIRIMGLAVVGVLAISAMAAAANASAASEQAVQQWSHSIRVLPLPSGGCFNASYPLVQWHKVACKAAPDHPYLPARGPFPGEVGNGNDYSAEVSGLITSAIGSIPSVSAGASEKGIDPNTGTSEPNTFTLQLNSNFFASSPMCAGHGLPSACQGWQQFVYADSPQENEVFMQYWLLQYNNTCPSGWNSFSFSGSSEIYCYKNSSASTLSGGRLAVSGLSSTTFEGSANVSGKDAVVLTTASGHATATGAGSVLSLGNGWKAAEFAIVGDCCGTQATFSANTTITVHTVVKSNSDGPPTCVNEGFTGETNNLNLEGTPALPTQPFPTIASQQTNGSATAASCATVGIGPPTVERKAASLVTSGSASLDGTVNPNGGNVTSCEIEYGTSSTLASATKVSCGSPGSGSSPVPVSVSVTGLAGDTVYYFRVDATNAGGDSKGSIETFTTLQSPPTVETKAASVVTSGSASLDGTVNPNGGNVTSCEIEYGTSSTLASATKVSCGSPGSGSSPVPVSESVTGLAGDTVYYFRVDATNAGGTSYGSDQTLTTLPNPPTVATGATSALALTSATLNATVDPNGGTVEDCHFDYGTTTSYGASVPCTTLPGSGTSAVAVSAPVNGLIAGTTYYFRIVASNAGGTNYGADQALTPVPDAGLASSSLAASLSGTVNVNVTCQAGGRSCTGTVTLQTLTAVSASAARHKSKKPKAAILTLAAGSFKVTGGHATTVKLHLFAKARTLLARTHVLHARATIVARDPAATRTTQTTVTIRAAKATHGHKS